MPPAGREDLFEEEMDGAAVEEELAPLTLQLALVHGRLGRHAEAAAAYEVPPPAAPCRPLPVSGAMTGGSMT